MNVMIATDGSDAAVVAALRAVELLRPDARIELVTVIPARVDPEEDAGGIEGPVLTEHEADDDWARAVAAGTAALARTEEALGGVDESTVLPTAGRTDQALITLVEREGPDVLVLGSHEPGWWERLLHGSLNDQLLHRAPCPLLIVSHREDR